MFKTRLRSGRYRLPYTLSLTDDISLAREMEVDTILEFKDDLLPRCCKKFASLWMATGRGAVVTFD